MILKRWLKRSFIFGISTAFLTPGFSHAYAEPSAIQGLVSRQGTVPLIKPIWGNFVLRTDSLNKLYSLRGYQAIWVDSNGLPNSMALSLKALLQTADRHGLNNSDYWDADVENLYKAANKNQKNWITFELGASEALIRYVTHLSTGRFDPEEVEPDVKKFPRKTFNEFSELNSAISSGGDLSTATDVFAPSHPRYRDLMDILVTLKSIKDQGGWPTLNSPGVVLKLGVTNPIIGQLRMRLSQMGYQISNVGGNTFDTEFENALKQYQANNGLAADGVIGTSSEVLRSLNYTVTQRISQVELNMEKLRWLPKSFETRHIFVNLATTEFFLFDEQGNLAKNFKTVNGDVFHRTPTMKDRITHVILNPYWNAPRSITLETLSKLRKTDKSTGATYLERDAVVQYVQKNNMLVMNEITDQAEDPASIEWETMTPKKLIYYFRQLPGPSNALGVVKFPLIENKFSIYMHDTNQKNYFAENRRHLSHGCIRLEEPLGLAAYLLQDQPGWSFEEILAFVPSPLEERGLELNKIVYLKKSMPVYLMFLTAEKGPDGTIRFVEDVYGQDIRLGKALQNKKNGNELF